MPVCVVYIEDESEMIDLVRQILSRKGFDVVGATGGNAGIRVLDQVQPALILLDLMMPDIDGWDVYKHIRATPALAETPVIIITARSQSADRMLASVAKVDDFIVKPFGPSDLLDSIERVLSRNLP